MYEVLDIVGWKEGVLVAVNITIIYELFVERYSAQYY